MKSLTIKEIAIAGLIAAVYAVLAAVLAPISFGVYQVRVSEALTVLPFLTPAAIPGLFIGCLVANVIGGMGWMDIVFGSLITLVAAFATRGIYHISNRDLGNLLAFLPPLLLWVVATRILLADNPASVALIPILLAIFLLLASAMLSARKNPRRVIIVAARIVSLWLLAWSFWMFRGHPDWYLLMLGGLALLAAWMMTWLITSIWAKGSNPNLALAPLPPVILNAFGVSVYLAPIIGVDYWFCVQMIGVGQLIACYLLGLPLLLIIEKRKSVLF